MKTLTEFFGAALKAALKTKEELLAAGKSAEELPAAIGEALKLEGDKLKHLLSALEAVGSKWVDLKRVVVTSIAEGEKAPGNAQQIGEVYFAVEYYPPLNKPAAPRGRGNGRDDKRGKKGGRGGGGKRDGGDRSKGLREPRRPPMDAAAAPKPVIGPKPTKTPTPAPETKQGS